jgi:hypothetical protein
MEPRTGPVVERELLADEPVRLPRQHEPEADPRPGTARLRHPGWWVALSLVLLVGIAVVVVDGTMRSREATRVDRCEHLLRVATGYTERRLGLVANYLEPTLTPSGRVQELHLADLMSTRAGRVLPRVQRADRFCDGVVVSPWHFSLVQRQSAATAYSAALVAVVQTVAAQGRVPFPDDATLQRLREKVGIDGG